MQTRKQNLISRLNRMKLPVYHEQHSRIYDYPADFIIKKVCAYFGMIESEVLDKTRKREIMDRRRILTALLVKYTKLSLKDIGKRCKQDHSTVINSRDVHNALFETDTEYMRLSLRTEQSLFE